MKISLFAIPALVCAALFLQTAAPALAHNLWIEGLGSERILLYGHQGSGHEGTQSLEYRPGYVREAKCLNSLGNAQSIVLKQEYPARLQHDCTLTWFLASSGYWSKTPYGTKNLPKAELEQVMESWLSFESVKRIDQWHPNFSKPISHELEISPQIDPYSLKVGDKVQLQTWYQGRPVAGVSVAYFGKPRGVTDKAGKINIRLNNPGFQLIQASLELPLNDGKADRIIQTSSLQFTLP